MCLGWCQSWVSVLIRTPSCALVFHLQIKDHPMKIIEMDGIDSVPTEIDMLTIAVAQRYSVYVEAKNASDTNYAMMVWQDPDM